MTNGKCYRRNKYNGRSRQGDLRGHRAAMLNGVSRGGPPEVKGMGICLGNGGMERQQVAANMVILMLLGSEPGHNLPGSTPETLVHWP